MRFVGYHATHQVMTENAIKDLESPSGNAENGTIERLIHHSRELALQGKFSEAHATLSEAEQLLQNQPDVDSGTPRGLVRIHWLLEKGRVYVLERTPSQARALFSEAWTLARAAGEDYFSVDAAQMMAEIEPQKQQQEWVHRALKIAESSTQDRVKQWLGSLYATLGWKLYDLRQFEKALEVFEKSLVHLKAEGNEKQIVDVKWSIGKVLRALQRIDEALVIQETLVTELRSRGVQDGRVYEELAECLHSLKRPLEAQNYFELAYRELSQDPWLKDNKPAQIKRLKDLGKVK